MLRFILPSLIWTALVITLSVVPSSSVSIDEVQFRNVDKVAHFIMYSLMSLFWVIGLKRQNIYIGVRRRAFHITVIGTMFLSFAIELIQEEFLPTRGFEVLDLIANGIGCIFGILIFKIIYYNSYK